MLIVSFSFYVLMAYIYAYMGICIARHEKIGRISELAKRGTIYMLKYHDARDV